MRGDRFPLRAGLVMAAAALVVLLAATLAVRLSARVAGDGSRPVARAAVVSTAPPSVVPPPRPVRLAELPDPFCWGCSWNSDAPLEFTVDLDLLAPLGTGEGNAALWFRDFAKDGNRFEAEGRPAYSERLVELTIDGDDWRVLPADDPFLLEAEPWVDQARCRFYSDVWVPAGFETAIPQLLTMIDLARSWVARGRIATDADDAREDFRRAIRLGRLLRQDDVTIIQDLVAIACIRLGAEALYDLAREEGDAPMMVVTSRVLADKDAMRLFTSKHISALTSYVTAGDEGSTSVRITDDELARVVELVRETPDRRFKFEGLTTLYAVRQFGPEVQAAVALAALEEAAGSDDEIVAEWARHYLTASVEEAGLEDIFGKP
jgi:hypothetical protein